MISVYVHAEGWKRIQVNVRAVQEREINAALFQLNAKRLIHHKHTIKHASAQSNKHTHYFRMRE